jgi:ribulose bisphosphate carboxylase small subunit
LVGYELVHGEVCQDAVRRFLERLRAAGIVPEEVITDASPLYPAVLRAVWPSAAHQLCLFHETRLVIDAVTQVIREVRADLPKAPPVQRAQGRFRKEPPPALPGADASDDRATRVALVHRLHREGSTQRAILRLTGHSRMTIRLWLREPVVASEAPAGAPVSPADTKTSVARASTPPTPPPIERPDTAAPADWRARPAPPPPPAPWQTWEQVQTAREDLRTYRFLLLRRPEHLSKDEQAQVDRLLALPGGDRLRQARHFLEEWSAIASDADGNRRTPDEAWERWQAWRQNAASRRLAPLRRVLERMDPVRAQRVLAFLQRPEGEATNNGAERGGRQFRHLQASCFKLRTDAAIDGAL